MNNLEIIQVDIINAGFSELLIYLKVTRQEDPPTETTSSCDSSNEEDDATGGGDTPGEDNNSSNNNSSNNATTNPDLYYIDLSTAITELVIKKLSSKDDVNEQKDGRGDHIFDYAVIELKVNKALKKIELIDGVRTEKSLGEIDLQL